jgi:hypothetical protein
MFKHRCTVEIQCVFTKEKMSTENKAEGKGHLLLHRHHQLSLEAKDEGTQESKRERNYTLLRELSSSLS